MDIETSSDVIDFIKYLKLQGKTILIATHNIFEISDLSDSIAFLSNGKIQRKEDTRLFFKNCPHDEKSRYLIQAMQGGRVCNENMLYNSKKELLEIFRDKSTFVILLIPVLIFSVFNMGISYLNKDLQTKIDICIQYNNQEAYNTLIQFISVNENYSINVINSGNPKS